MRATILVVVERLPDSRCLDFSRARLASRWESAAIDEQPAILYASRPDASNRIRAGTGPVTTSRASAQGPGRGFHVGSRQIVHIVHMVVLSKEGKGLTAS